MPPLLVVAADRTSLDAAAAGSKGAERRSIASGKAADRKPAASATKGPTGRPAGGTPRADARHTLLPEPRGLHAAPTLRCAHVMLTGCPKLAACMHAGRLPCITSWHCRTHHTATGVSRVDKAPAVCWLIKLCLLCLHLCRAVAAALLAVLQQVRSQLSPVPPPTADSSNQGPQGAAAAAHSCATSFSFGSDAQVECWHTGSGIDVAGLTQVLAMVLRVLRVMGRHRCMLELGECAQTPLPVDNPDHHTTMHPSLCVCFMGPNY